MKYMSAVRLVLSGALLLLLTACDAIHTADFDSAVYEGIIAPSGMIQAWEPATRYTYVLQGDITRSSVIVITASLPMAQTLIFEGFGPLDTGLSALRYDEGSRVEAGSPIFEDWFFYVNDGTFNMGMPIRELDIIERDRLLAAQRRFEQQFLQTHNEHINRLAEARHVADSVNNNEIFLQRLYVTHREILLARFLHDSTQTRRNYAQRLEDMDNTLRMEPLYAPFDGILSNISLSIAPDTTVPRWTAAFTFVDDNFFEFMVHAPLGVLRHGAVIPISIPEVDFAFYAEVVSDAFATGLRTPRMHFVLRPVNEVLFRGALDDRGICVTDLIGMTLPIEIEEVLVRDTLILPANAIRQELNRHYILRYHEGRLKKRYVTLGIQTASQVQILKGVGEGWRVVLP